ncbi:MAG: thioredoxin family protein [Clostridiales bacterium]|nr:thioredoxin family protein [Clostridiales bacterium]
MNIKVLGTGCKKCDQVYDLVLEILQEETLTIQVDKVEDLKSIVAYGVMSTPTLVINGEILFKGKVPSKKKLKETIIARV